MELKFSKIVNREKKQATMRLYGELGDKPGQINGHYFARELAYLAKNYDEVTIKVNCRGGLVSYGLSIISELMTAQAYIIIEVVGVAASMGAVLLPAADFVVIYDYAKIMIHSPFYIDKNGKAVKNLSAKDKKSLSVLKSMLAELLEKRGISKPDVEEMLKTDTWFSADEAKAAKLVDEVKKTGRKKELAALEPLQLVARINDENNPKIEKMDKVIAALVALGATLPDNATDEQVAEVIKDFVKKPEPEGDGKLSKAVVDTLMAVGRKTNVVTDKNESIMRGLAESQSDVFVALIDPDTVVAEKPEGEKKDLRLTNILAGLQAGNNGGKTEEKDFTWYEQNDPAALARMEIHEPEKFKKLEAADKAKYE